IFIKFKTECHLFLLAQNEKLKKRKFFSALRFCAEEAPRHARGKRTPGAEINKYYLQPLS
ncbi:hypothetical protein, partial [Neobacillus cucumis]|uniref:hypothetical protein n=1 Tax=Neobacillus cucumis TaxID=1740721 RepID=UPI001966951D